MTATPFFPFEVDRDDHDWRKKVVVKGLEERITFRLSKGRHGFDSHEAMFEKLGIEHIAAPDLFCVGCSWLSMPTRRGTIMKMSYAWFRHFVHRMEGVRLVRNPRWQVEREGKPRFELIVS